MYIGLVFREIAFEITSTKPKQVERTQTNISFEHMFYVNVVQYFFSICMSFLPSVCLKRMPIASQTTCSAFRLRIC